MKGATCFKDIKTIIGHGFTIFRKAPGKLSLLSGDGKWKHLQQPSAVHSKRDGKLCLGLAWCTRTPNEAFIQNGVPWLSGYHSGIAEQ
jgi:hypothetical protein